MQKTKVVVVGKHGARVYINPPDIVALKEKGEVFINPNLDLVKGVSPSFWRVVNGRIAPMAESDQKVMKNVRSKTVERRMPDDSGVENTMKQAIKSTLEQDMRQYFEQAIEESVTRYVARTKWWLLGGSIVYIALQMGAIWLMLK